MFHWRGKLFQGWVTTTTHPVRREINLPASTFRHLKNSYGNTAEKQPTQGVLPQNTLLFMVWLAVPPVLEIYVYFYIPFVVLCWYILNVLIQGNNFKQCQGGLLKFSLSSCLQRPLLHLPSLSFKSKSPAATGCGQSWGQHWPHFISLCPFKIFASWWEDKQSFV